MWRYFMSRPVWPAGHYVSGLSVRPSVFPSVRHVLGVPLCVQRPAKTMPFQQIIMHALQSQHDLDVHLLFCVDLDLHITSSEVVFNLDFFVDPHWWVPLCVQRPAKAMPFQQIIKHALQCQHGLDVHLLFCVDLDLNITSSRGRA